MARAHFSNALRFKTNNFQRLLKSARIQNNYKNVYTFLARQFKSDPVQNTFVVITLTQICALYAMRVRSKSALIQNNHKNVYTFQARQSKCYPIQNTIVVINLLRCVR